MKHVHVTTRVLPALAQDCEDVTLGSLFTGENLLDTLECLIPTLQNVIGDIRELKLAF